MLTRYYILIGLTSLSIAAFVFGYGYYHFENKKYVSLGEAENLQFGKFLQNSLWQEFYPFIDDIQNFDNKELRQHQIIRQTNQTVRASAKDLHILQVSVFSPNGNTIFSTQLQQLGDNVSQNKLFKKALSGKTASTISQEPIVNGLDGMRLDRHTVTTCYPIQSPFYNYPEAVIKIVSDVSDSVEDGSQTETMVYALIGIMFFIHFILLVIGIKKINNKFFNQTSLIKKQQNHIEHRYYHDSLTLLPKFTIFHEELETVMKNCLKEEFLIAVLIVDMDRLQKVNDTLGYKYGDQLICEASVRLKQCIRKEDIISRLGGERFVIMLTKISVIDQVEEVVEHIRVAISDPYHIADTELFISPSIGVSMHPFNENENAESLIRKANSAMHKAKSMGKNIVDYYNPGTSYQTASRFTIENALRHALERNEFELHYQPVISLKKQNVYALEALLRWHSPELGFLSPLEFIPLLEDTGLIKEVGSWILEKACTDAVNWQNAGYDNLKINVNVSAVQFLQNDILRQTSNAINVSGISPYLLDLEITESLLIDGVGDTIQTLESLNDMGISLSIDDFGTGYSSLAYLKRLPINTLKIDRSFIRDVTSSIDDAAIIDAICALARSLRFNVLVEGIETAEQLTYVRNIGVDAVQGYLFSPPLPATEIEAFLNKPLLLDELARAI